MYGVLSQECETEHIQKVGTRKLSAHCGRDADNFGKAIAPRSFHPRPSTDFRDILGAWATAIGLNGGMLSSNNSLAHVLSQLVVTKPPGRAPSLNKTMPSLAEALAVLSNSMLMKASINATFDDRPIFDAPTPDSYFPYNVIVQTQQYRSGPPVPWQKVLYPILVVMFLANWYCLIYFFREMGLVIDFLEPRNLFSVAIDSPSESKRRAGEGPIGDHGDARWILRRDHDQKLYFRKANKRGLSNGGRRDGRVFVGFEKQGEPDRV